MLQLNNNTPFAAAIALFPNEQGVDTLYTIVKATFEFYPQLVLAPQQIEPQKKDEYSGAPGESSLLTASDYHPGKAGTDIVMTGSACAPDQQEISQLDISLQIGRLCKTIRVFGERYWERGRPTPAQSFSQMPLTYENAFGGRLLLDGQLHQLDARNPVGLGFTGDLAAAEVEGWLLPHLENPQQLIFRVGSAPEPACFAPIAPHWMPRMLFAGTYDEEWQRNRAPYLPRDYSPQFMNSAPADQIYPDFLRGSEPVVIEGMHPIGRLDFCLPAIRLINRVHSVAGEATTPFVLETVHLQPNQLQLSMVWRAAYQCGRHFSRVKHVNVHMGR